MRFLADENVPGDAVARFFDTSPEFWMNLQAMHDLTKTRIENGEAIARDVRRMSLPLWPKAYNFSFDSSRSRQTLFAASREPSDVAW
jgi:hypothetical protein